MRRRMRLSTATTSLTLLDDVIAEIAPVAFPDLKTFEAKNRVRDQIRYAERKCDIRVDRIQQRPFVDRRLLLDWAVGKWPTMAATHKPNEVSATIEARLPLLKASLVGQAGPITLSECQDAFVQLTARLATAEMLLDAERAKHRKCAADLASLQKRQSVTRQKKAAAGRRGGRPRNK